MPHVVAFEVHHVHHKELVPSFFKMRKGLQSGSWKALVRILPKFSDNGGPISLNGSLGTPNHSVVSSFGIYLNDRWCYEAIATESVDRIGLNQDSNKVFAKPPLIRQVLLY